MIHGTQGKELPVTLGTISKVTAPGNTLKKSRSLTSSLRDMTLNFDSSFPSSSLLFLSIPFLFFVGFFFLAVAFGCKTSFSEGLSQVPFHVAFERATDSFLSFPR